MLQGCCHGGTAAGERRRRCSANRVAYGLIGLAQKEARGSRVLTEGLRWTELRRRGLVGKVRRRVVAELAEEGRCGAPLGIWAPRVGSRRPCDGATWSGRSVKAGIEEKCGGGATHRRWSQGSIPVVQGPGSRKEASVMLLESRRGFCAAPVGLWCGGAA